MQKYLLTFLIILLTMKSQVNEEISEFNPDFADGFRTAFENVKYSLESSPKNWKEVDNGAIWIKVDSVYWYRGEMNDTIVQSINRLGIMLGFTDPFEVYVNGHLIGDSYSKNKGNLLHFFFVPDSVKVQSGNHVLVKLRSENGLTSIAYELNYGSYEQLLVDRYESNLWETVYGVIFLILAIYRFFSYEGFFSKKANSLFTLFLLILGLNNLIATIPVIYNIHYDFFIFIVLTQVFLTLAIAITVFHFYMERFEYPKKLWITIIYYFLAFFFLALALFGVLGEYYFIYTFLIIFYLLYYAYKEKKKYVFYDFISILVLFISVIVLDEDVHSDSIGLLIMSLILNYSVTLESREEKSNSNELKILSSRLQTELLKKSIQPHFILNSLNAAVDWIEENPKKGTELINDLATEFYLFSEICEKSLVSINDELKLCDLHLSIMSFRTEMTYELIRKGIEGDELIPPGVFHTLTENAISHNKSRAGHLSFYLERITEANELRYLFKAPLNSDRVFTKEGTGYKYIRSRLKENYQEAFHLSYFAEHSFWITEIKLKLK